MDDARFDHWTRLLTACGSRRTMLGLVAGTLGLAAGLPAVADAKQKNRKQRKPRLNEYGCLDVGKACGGNSSVCCSGICEGKKSKKGKKDTSRCVAHDVLGCRAGQDQCAGVAVSCGVSPLSRCYRTTGNASFCSGSGGCRDCQNDADCVEQGFGQGAACVVCAECTETGKTACFSATL